MFLKFHMYSNLHLPTQNLSKINYILGLKNYDPNQSQQYAILEPLSRAHLKSHLVIRGNWIFLLGK